MSFLLFITLPIYILLTNDNFYYEYYKIPQTLCSFYVYETTWIQKSVLVYLTSSDSGVTSVDLFDVFYPNKQKSLDKFP